MSNPMSFDTFIKELESANPAIFKAASIKITVVSLKAQLRRAFDAGHAQGMTLHREIESMQNQNTGSFFDGLFKN